jgi:farnesyl diphosphate synthase
MKGHMMMSPDKVALSAQMQNIAQLTNTTLIRIFDEEKRNGAPTRLVDAMSYSTLNGGKRVRAFLIVATAAMFMQHDHATSDIPQGILNVAAAFECLHAYSLIHDDLPAMDDASMRRGKPSCHLAFDQATAILAGDALQSLAFQLLSAPSTHPDPLIRSQLVHNLAVAAGDAGMAGGQMLDLEAETQALDYSATARMQSLKTGALIISSVLAGGQYADAKADIMADLAIYGKAIGQAFQIADDLLDAEGDEQLVGKPLGQDNWRGKATFVAHLGLDGARQEARNQIDIARQSLAHIKAKNPLWQGYLDDMAEYIITRDA